MNDHIGFSSFISGTFDELRARNQIALIHLAIAIPLGAVTAYLLPNDTGSIFAIGEAVDQPFFDYGPIEIIAALASFALGMAVYYWLFAALTRQTKSPSFDRLLPFIGISILSALGILFGMLLLIVPGMILIARWTPALCLVITRDSNATGVFGDSFDMTEGKGWPIFFAFLTLILISSAVVEVLSVFDFGQILTAILASIGDQVSGLLLTALSATVYRQLSDLRENTEEVFE